MTKALKTTGMLLAAWAVSACAQTPDGSTAGRQPQVGMANPASVHCVKIGGTLRMENTPQGQRGICVLPDGSEMEEWALFRRDNPPAGK